MSTEIILGIIGAVLGVIGLITGYTFYRRSLRLKEPRYSVSSNNLIRDNVTKMNHLEISYKGHKVENLTVSKILFWNNGHDTIERNDIAGANPLRIECSANNSILDVSIIKANNPSSQFLVQPENDGTSAKVSFDYLDKNHGAVIQVVHTGKGSNDISIQGDIKGATLRLYLSRERLVERITTNLAVILALILVVASVLLTEGLNSIPRVIIVIVVFVVSIIGLGFLSALVDEKLSNQFPRDFKGFR